MRRILSITATTTLIGVAAWDIVAVDVVSRPVALAELQTEPHDLIVADK